MLDSRFVQVKASVAEFLKLLYVELPRISPAFTATCAIIALFIARRQIRTVRQNEAKRQYSQFLFNSADSKIDSRFVSGQIDGENDPDKDKYKLYLTALMLACEEILGEFEGDKDYKVWRNAVKNKLIPHKNNFCIIDQRSMDETLIEIIKEIQRDGANCRSDSVRPVSGVLAA